MCAVFCVFFVLSATMIEARPIPESMFGREAVLGKPLNYVDNKDLVYINEDTHKKDDPRTLDTLIDIYQGGILAGLSLIGDVMGSPKMPVPEALRGKLEEYAKQKMEKMGSGREMGKEVTTTTTMPIETTTSKIFGDTTTTQETPTTTKQPFFMTTTLMPTKLFPIFMATTLPPNNNHKGLFFGEETGNSDIFATYRKERDDKEITNNEIEGDASIEEITSRPTTMAASQTSVKANQEEEDIESSEEEQPGLVGGLISTFLGGLSKPDGGVDLDALVGLIGGLSVQKDDGTFDFSGLTEVLQGFLGGEGGGGSDVGSFLGGVLGATIKGLAKPPGAKGAGIFAGNVLNGILPGLSAPPPPKEESDAKPQEGLDSGGFLGGLLSTILGGSSSSSSGSSSGGGATNGSVGFFTHIKQGLFKTIFRIISTILGASSANKHR